jgi:two-component system, NtrC family, sensor kinase
MQQATEETKPRNLNIKNMFGSLSDQFNDILVSLSRDRYKMMKVIALTGTLSIIPLFIVIMTSYTWVQHNLNEDFSNQWKWQIENAKRSIDSFVDRELSAVRILAHAFTYEELADPESMRGLLTTFKNEYKDLVDFGLIDANGIQRLYVGPYKLQDKDYANQEWFHSVVVRGGQQITDVFMGFRGLPHFVIAVKKEVPEKNTFVILRATIDLDTMNRHINEINLGEKDDAFLINREGILQTNSRFHGKVLDKFTVPVPIQEQGPWLGEIPGYWKEKYLFGYAHLKGTPWLLSIIVKSTPKSMIGVIMRNKLLMFFAGLSIIIGIVLNLWIARTVTQWVKDAERRKEEAVAESEHASKLASIGRLAAGVAHEINNPLAIINEKAGLMRDILDVSSSFENKDKFLKLMDGISDGVVRARTITHRLLGFARRMDVTPEVIDLNDAIREVIGFLEKEFLYRSIHLDLQFDEHLPKVKIDRGQLQQVFLNIINNALDAVKEGGTISVTSEVKDSSALHVMISDTGHGIPKDVLKHIFDPFFTTKDKGKGTGLGLSISYGIMKKLGGTIFVESEVSSGTKFTIEIPRKPHIF